MSDQCDNVYIIIIIDWQTDTDTKKKKKSWWTWSIQLDKVVSSLYIIIQNMKAKEFHLYM